MPHKSCFVKLAFGRKSVIGNESLYWVYANEKIDQTYIKEYKGTKID